MTFLYPIEGYNRTMIAPDPSNSSSYYFSQYGQVTRVDSLFLSLFHQDKFLETYIFKNRVKDGFFVEAGAVDSVDDSNTLVIYQCPPDI